VYPLACSIDKPLQLIIASRLEPFLGSKIFGGLENLFVKELIEVPLYRLIPYLILVEYFM
jgi:hypothetical protein